MICMFCYEELRMVAHPAGDIRFKIILCRGCQSPDHYTLHRELYRNKVKLYDQIQVDEFIVTRYYQETHPGSKVNYSKLYKDALGVIDRSPDFTPLSQFPPVCELDHIVDLAVHDLDVLKRKLKIWTTFS